MFEPGGVIKEWKVQCEQRGSGCQQPLLSRKRVQELRLANLEQWVLHVVLERFWTVCAFGYLAKHIASRSEPAALGLPVEQANE